MLSQVLVSIASSRPMRTFYITLHGWREMDLSVGNDAPRQGLLIGQVGMQ